MTLNKEIKAVCCCCQTFFPSCKKFLTILNINSFKSPHLNSSEYSFHIHAWPYPKNNVVGYRIFHLKFAFMK